MSEINNNQMPIQPGQAAQPKDQQPVQDYKEAVAPPNADSMGRVLLNGALAAPDQIKTGVDTAMVAATSPAVINQSDVLFRAAMKAGLSYPEAATFATEQ